MPPPRRQFIAQHPYELAIRARSGLPFVCLDLIKLLLASAMARTQRDCKVILCHFIWMENHLHLLFIARDAEQCVQFYSELMKKLTDYTKCLLGLDYLHLWESPMLAPVLDLNMLLSRIAYFYANPARADLVNTIGEYPGLSSWAQFSAEPQASSHSQLVPWVRQPSIPTLGPRYISPRRDREITKELLRVNRFMHELTFHPNAMYALFGVTDEQEIASLNQRVFDDLRGREEEFAKIRKEAGRSPLGAQRLREQPIMKPHTPKRSPTDRKIYFLTSSKELALEFLEEFRTFCALCRAAYEAWRDGNYHVEWPPGACRPPLRPVANAIML